MPIPMAGPLSGTFGPMGPFVPWPPPAYDQPLQQAGIAGQGVVTTAVVVSGAMTITGEGQAAAAAPVVLPYSMGGAVSTNTASLPVTVSTANGLGDSLAAWVTSNNALPTGVSDPVNGAWTAVGTQVNNGNQIGQWFLMPNAGALTTSQAVTATFASTAGSKTISVIGCAGLSAAPFDTSASGGATSATPSFTANGLVQAGELVLMGVVNNNTGGTPAFTAPFASIVGSQHTGANQFASTGWAVLTGQNNVTGSATITSAQWLVSAITLQIPGVPGSEQPVLTVTGTGSVSSAESVSAGLTVAGAGTVAAAAAIDSALTIAGAGIVTAAGGAAGSLSIAGAGTVSLPGVVGAALNLTGLGAVNTATVVLAALSIMGAGSVAAAAAVVVNIVPGVAAAGVFPQPSVALGQYPLPFTVSGQSGYGSAVAGGEAASAQPAAIAGQMPLPSATSG